MSKEDIVLNQIKKANEPLLAIQLLAQLVDSMMVESHDATREIREILLGDNTPDGKKKSIVGQIETLKTQIAAQSEETKIHGRLIYGDPTNAKENGLLADVHASVRTVKAIQKLVWIVIGVIVPLIIGSIITLTKYIP